MRRVFAFIGSLTFLLIVVLFYVRPWYLGWGATDDERVRPMPSDVIVPAAATSETRAITINAPASAVWPWVAQIGQDRGGFYSFDLLENLLGCEMPSGDRLLPDRQQWNVGDRLWMYPKNKAGGAGFATLRVYDPGRTLGFGARKVGTALTEPEDGSWSFELIQIDGHTTRLLTRNRGTSDRSLWGAAFNSSVFEIAHFVMEKRMLLGIKDLAESHTRRPENDILVGTWVFTAFTMLAAFIAGFRRKTIAGAVGAFTAAGLVFEILTLGQPAPATSIVLALVPAVILRMTNRR